MEFFLLVGEECEFRAKRGYFGVVGDGAALGFVVAVIVRFGQHFSDGFPGESSPGVWTWVSGFKGPPYTVA